MGLLTKYSEALMDAGIESGLQGIGEEQNINETLKL
jgi:hypothetical protein